MRWADVTAFPAGGVASADCSLGPAVGSGGKSELEQAIERALEQRLGPLHSIISELTRENYPQSGKFYVKGEALQSQPSQQQVTPLPPSSLRSSTSTRPDVAEMDTNDDSGSGQEANGRDDRPCTAKILALDSARPEVYPNRRGEVNVMSNYKNASIQQDFSLFGTPLYGKDVCGYRLTGSELRMRVSYGRLPDTLKRPTCSQGCHYRLPFEPSQVDPNKNVKNKI
ncbi:hypothetical protein HPB51_017415 [Rhipicephalus microplus]|uniref:Uncharacterized protein n=1 Tax=Rhipicephalus microplus TaxID=6941 RepID=A0A9J6D5H3_RHIMP|nr:hypothetical protein HPB51_017415 [Rhipicephalus microplus]